jgi:hypothetical protein
MELDEISRRIIAVFEDAIAGRKKKASHAAGREVGT